MKVWAATRDSQVIDLLNTALRMRWPNSGRLIVPDVTDQEAPSQIKGCDLAIVDTCLDTVDANEIIHQIRRDSEVPVLALSSSKGDQGITARALANGADDYLFKPVEIIELIFHIESVAGIKHSARG
ncbi:response regulator [Dehalogenimonas sp. 4OHTPN]|uniref:Response regulator n=1 Tax=Dehalogenimonas sp. 4OHTPN TaxID=3166643 RepID=A0AAU8G989_9CHLR